MAISRALSQKVPDLIDIQSREGVRAAVTNIHRYLQETRMSRDELDRQIINTLSPLTWAPPIAAAATIEPIQPVQPISGSAAISNISAGKESNRFVLLAEDGFSVVTGGNIGAAVTVPEGTSVELFLNHTDNLWYPSLGSGSPTLSTVTMTHDDTNGGLFTVYLPNGTVLDITGTTTEGLQEAIDYAHQNGYALFVNGGGITPPGFGGEARSRISHSTPLHFRTGQGNVYRFYGVDLWYTGNPALDGIDFDSWDFSDFHFRGQIVYTGDLAAVRINPQNDNGESFIGWTSSRFDIASIAVVNPTTGLPENTHGIGMQISPIDGLIINNDFFIGEINGGIIGLQIDDPAVGESFTLNRVVAPAIHAQRDFAVTVGTSAQTRIHGNIWDLILAPTGATSYGLSTWALGDVYRLTINGGNTGIQVNSSADKNHFTVGRNETTIPAVDDSTTKNNPGLFSSQHLSFSATKGGTNQTGIVTATATKVTWPTVDWAVPVGGFSTANNRWTPGIIGKIRISACVQWETMVDQSAMMIAVYKNGAQHRAKSEIASGVAAQGPSISVLVEVIVITDYFEIFVSQSSGSNKDIAGGASLTWFMGERTD